MQTVYLNIGSNRGNRMAFINSALDLLHRAWPQAVLRTSPAVYSRPWGFQSDSPFTNVGVALDFDDGAMPGPLEVLDTVQAIERQVSADSPHRNDDGSYRDRDIDIDIIDMDGVSVDSERLTLPHPRAEARSFVMQPMQFLCPGWHPRHTATRKKDMADLHRDTASQFRAKAKRPIALVLDNIRSLNNIGSMFRSADAFCVDRVVLCGITATPPADQIHKTALGAEDTVAWQYYATTAEAVQALRGEGWTITCLEQVHGSVPLQNYRPAAGQRTAVIVGNEVAGVDPHIVDMCDAWLEIPQEGTKHSLNVAVSAALAMWHLFSLPLRDH